MVSIWYFFSAAALEKRLQHLWTRMTNTVTVSDVVGLCLWCPTWGKRKRELDNGGTKAKATVRAGNSSVSLGHLECANPLPSRIVPPAPALLRYD